MGLFKAPKVPTPPPPPNPQITPYDATPAPDNVGLAPMAGSLISTGARGLTRRASTQRRSLIGG